MGKEDEAMEFDLVSLISNVGFPIALVIYLMVRFESKIEKLDNSINNLTSVIQGGQIKVESYKEDLSLGSLPRKNFTVFQNCN